jgi:hypothetical protein
MAFPSELDQAQLKFEFRQLYSEVGYEAAIQILVELLTSARIMSEVIVEESQKEPK